MLVPVKFKSSWRCYNAGETAGFDPAVAKDLVDSDVATWVSLDEVQADERAQEQAIKDGNEEKKAGRIRDSNRFYDHMIGMLNQDKDSERIAEIVAEKEKMAKLIAETKMKN